MIKLIDIINESDIAKGKYLYHYTTLRNIKFIIDDNYILKANRDNCVSFTRDPNMSRTSTETEVQICLSRNILSSKYKLEDFHCNDYYDSEDFDFNEDDYNENEERVEGDVNIRSSIISISINIKQLDKYYTTYHKNGNVSTRKIKDTDIRHEHIFYKQVKNRLAKDNIKLIEY